MKKVYKVMFVVFIIINMYSILYITDAKDIWQMGNNFLTQGSTSIDISLYGLFAWLGDGLRYSTMKNNFSEILGFLWGLGLLVIFISTIVLGIKYMLVLPNERSRIKQATTPYIIGVVIIFGALTIWRLLIAILEGSMLGGS